VEAKDALDTTIGLVRSQLEDAAFAGTYADQIEAAQERVARIAQKIEQLDDAIVVKDIEGAAAGLGSAQDSLQSGMEDLVSVSRSAEKVQHTLERRLGGLGKSGRAASGALKEGSVVIEHANEANAKSTALARSLEQLEPLAARVAKEANDYRVQLDGGSSDLDGDQLARVRDSAVAAVRNAWAWAEWVDGEKGHLQEVRDYLAGGSYRKAYEEGVEGELNKIWTRMDDGSS
jgi:chromosome segregation ATPase